MHLQVYSKLLGDGAADGSEAMEAVELGDVTNNIVHSERPITDDHQGLIGGGPDDDKIYRCAILIMIPFWMCLLLFIRILNWWVVDLTIPPPRRALKGFLGNMPRDDYLCSAKKDKDRISFLMIVDRNFTASHGVSMHLSRFLKIVYGIGTCTAKPTHCCFLIKCCFIIFILVFILLPLV